MHHLLVVDDSNPVRAVVTKHLRRRGYRVTSCGSGTAAQAAFLAAEPPISALITDLHMPVMNGYELAREVRLVQPNLPIVFLTGAAQDETRAVLASIGWRAIAVSKPFDAAALLDGLATLLKGHDA